MTKFLKLKPAETKLFSLLSEPSFTILYTKILLHNQQKLIRLPEGAYSVQPFLLVPARTSQIDQ